MKKVFFLVMGAGLMVACASSTPKPVGINATPDAVTKAIAKADKSCKTDADCVAVKKGCCPCAGYAAVNTKAADKVNKVYTASFDFPSPDSDAKPVQVKAEQAAQPSCSGSAAAEEVSSVKLDKKVIGRVDIARNARYKTIIVGADAVVTALASDEACNRGIAIVRE